MTVEFPQGYNHVALDSNDRRLRWPPIGHLGLGSMVHPGLKWPTNLKV